MTCVSLVSQQRKNAHDGLDFLPVSNKVLIDTVTLNKVLIDTVTLNKVLIDTVTLNKVLIDTVTLNKVLIDTATLIDVARSFLELHQPTLPLSFFLLGTDASPNRVLLMPNIGHVYQILAVFSFDY